MGTDFNQLPADLPVPEDDGAPITSPESPVPELALPSTQGGPVDLSELAQGRLVAYVYPTTGKPGQTLPAGWDDIPGARGCTPQSCAFRDSLAEFSSLGASVVGAALRAPRNSESSASASTSPSPCSATVAYGRREAALPTFEARE